MCVYLCVFADAADDINRIASSLYTLGTQDSTDLCKYARTHAHRYAHMAPTPLCWPHFLSFCPRFFLKVSELFEKTRVSHRVHNLLSSCSGLRAKCVCVCVRRKSKPAWLQMRTWSWPIFWSTTYESPRLPRWAPAPPSMSTKLASDLSLWIKASKKW